MWGKVRHLRSLHGRNERLQRRLAFMHQRLKLSSQVLGYCQRIFACFSLTCARKHEEHVSTSSRKEHKVDKQIAWRDS